MVKLLFLNVDISTAGFSIFFIGIIALNVHNKATLKELVILFWIIRLETVCFFVCIPLKKLHTSCFLYYYYFKNLKIKWWFFKNYIQFAIINIYQKSLLFFKTSGNTSGSEWVWSIRTKEKTGSLDRKVCRTTPFLTLRLLNIQHIKPKRLTFIIQAYNFILLYQTKS